MSVPDWVSEVARAHNVQLREHFAAICDAHNRIDDVIAAQHLQHQVNSDAITLLGALLDRVTELETEVVHLKDLTRCSGFDEHRARCLLVAGHFEDCEYEYL